MASQSPPSAILAAFGLSGEPVPLEGGQRSSWRVGGAVLKPLDAPEPELEWQERLLGAISCDGFRVARPIRSRAGSLLVAGWCAWEVVAGRHEERRWPEIIAVGGRFHAALAALPCPDFIARRTDPWAIGDRVAWGDQPVRELASARHLRRLVSLLEPVDAPCQLIHGDLTGNVLFDDDLPPAVIDFSPYWRPAAFASAIVVADALVWEGADEGTLEAVADVEGFGQYLVRALIYRVVADRLLHAHEPRRPDDADPYLPAVELASRLAAGA